MTKLPATFEIYSFLEESGTLLEETSLAQAQPQASTFQVCTTAPSRGIVKAGESVILCQPRRLARFPITQHVLI